MNANSGEPWSEMDLWELKTSMEYGRSFADVAGCLYREEDEVRDMDRGSWHQRGRRHGEVLPAVPDVLGLEEPINALRSREPRRRMEPASN
jgi:hypothetical protein